MSKVCEKCGKGPVTGRSFARRGLAKKKGGVGRKITGITKRRFFPNVQIVRIRENGAVRRAKLCTKCLRMGLKNGTISKAPRKPRPAKTAATFVPVRTPALAEDEPREAPEPRPDDLSDRLAEEIDEAYEQEKASEREERLLPLDEASSEGPGEGSS